MSSRARFSPAATAALPDVQDAAAWNEMLDRQGRMRPVWQAVATDIQRWSPDERGAVAISAGRMLQDLGTTFNVYSDVGGAGQPYEIDAIPLLIPPEDWARVSAGLVQRMRVLDAILFDLYGPQNLLKEGLIPPDLVHANPAFKPGTRGISPVGEKFLITTGCDLIRTPDGQWTVLRDHTGGPGGLGQALENRSVTSNVLPDVFEASQIARLAPFFDLERATLQSLTPPRGEIPNIVILTPGFRHPSYFEHAYKARLLGFPLVEPADLTVRERRLYLKTLSGLRRIDGVICRVDDDALDPLEFWKIGGGGVPGMVEAWRSGNVALANAPGSGFASSISLFPFLPAICRAWFDEDLILPFVETWWLGQHEVRQGVLDQLHRFVLLPAFRSDPLLPVRCSSLSPAARRQWAAAIEERPHDFVAQRDVTPSQAPSLQGRNLHSRPVVWRAFTLNSPAGPVVLPGGLARVGKTGEPPQLWPAHAGYTKDVWVPDEAAGSQTISASLAHRPSAARHPSAFEVPSRIAEQLFWVGRYAERIEFVTRLLRVTLRSLIGEADRRQKDHQEACLALVAGSGVLPDIAGVSPDETLETLTKLIHENSARSGLVRLARLLLSNAAAARDRLSDDTWRFFNRLENIVHAPVATQRAPDLLRTLDTLVLHLAAFSGMEAENMTRGQGWRFLETGRRIERALGGLSLLQAAAERSDGEATILEPLLETCDSVMTYRRRHFSRPRWEGVVDLIFFDLTNPRSVAFQVDILHQESSRFPGNPDTGLFPRILEALDGLASRFRDSKPPDCPELESLGESIEAFSDLLTQHYFSHSVRRVY